MGCTAEALGPAPIVAAEGPAAEDGPEAADGPAAAEGPAAEDGPAASTSAVGDPAMAEEEPATGEDGPWRTRGL